MKYDKLKPVKTELGWEMGVEKMRVSLFLKI